MRLMRHEYAIHLDHAGPVELHQVAKAHLEQIRQRKERRRKIDNKKDGSPLFLEGRLGRLPGAPCYDL
eukprot:782800-Pelagomonas_calceolata.AAC.2